VNKPTGIDTLTVLATKWKILSDSVTSDRYTTPWGWIPIPGAYHGVPDDYYLFDTSYHVTVYENGNNLIGAYKLLPNAQFLIDSTEKRYVGTIKTINKVNAIFEWEDYSSNGGRYFRRLSLFK
jgi:hypothetical protein